MCSINFATPTLANAINNNEIEYYCVWDLKGGFPSPYSNGSLENGIGNCFILSGTGDKRYRLQCILCSYANIRTIQIRWLCEQTN